MTVIKQAKIPTGTLKLKRLKNKHPELSSNQYMYVVEFPDGDRTDPRFTKERGLQEFRRVLNVRKETAGLQDLGRAADNAARDLFGGFF